MMSQTVLSVDNFEPPKSSRKHWTRDECRRLMEQGFLEEGRFELIEGEIILKMPQNEPHVFVCTQVFLALIDIFGRDYVRIPAPIAINSHNEPEPDVSVTRGTSRDYLRQGTPQPEDMRLVVEVSDTTLRLDKGRKARVYVRAGIHDYWIISLKARTLIVHRQPTQSGYQEISTLTDPESVSPLAAAHAQIRVADLLP